MRANARVVAERTRGRSRCTTLRSAPPLTFRETATGLHLVGTAAGPLGGDDLTLEVTVGPGASLTVRSAAAQLVLPAPTRAASSTNLTVEVGEGASLRWLPEPTVVVRHADHRLTTFMALAAGADLVWRDEVVLGRTDEPGGSLLHRLRVERAGLPLLCTEVALGPVWPTSAGPAGTGGAHVVASTLLVGAAARAVLARSGAPDGAATAARPVRSAALALADDAVLLTALGDELDPTRFALALRGAPGT